ncbi:Uncharacterized protein dnl_53300 [Desulfonema limicola]|uniref:Uncharacterized protein n=1 Tax=Desulfonema limicola TaxID=45656 RepID=A0A975BCQ6_9BACT|nr:Uncharacterized protein dnl_53300 [Desulfonema limicola]
MNKGKVFLKFCFSSIVLDSKKILAVFYDYQKRENIIVIINKNILLKHLFLRSIV